MLECDFPLIGCEPDPVVQELPAVRLKLSSLSNVLDGPASRGKVVLDSRRSDGAVNLRVFEAKEAGFLIQCGGWGTFEIDASGSRVRCAPHLGVDPWQWQRSLVAQILPFLCLLHGYEPFHASSVEMNGAAVAIMGGSGFGKSTVAVELILRGWKLVADDVLAVGLTPPSGGSVIAYPGVGLMNLRSATTERLGQRSITRLGRRIAETEDGIRVAIDRHRSPLPLMAIYRLRVLPRNAGLQFGPTQSLAEALLGNAFIPILDTPARLVHQLDVFAALARTVRVVEVGAPVGVDFSALADAIANDIGSVGGSTESLVSGSDARHTALQA